MAKMGPQEPLEDLSFHHSPNKIKAELKILVKFIDEQV